MSNQTDKQIAENIIARCQIAMAELDNEMCDIQTTESASRKSIKIVCDMIEAKRFLGMDTSKEEEYLSGTIEYLKSL